MEDSSWNILRLYTVTYMFWIIETSKKYLVIFLN